MEDTVFTAVTSVVSSGVVSSAAVWFLRSFIGERLRAAIQYEYDQKLEAFKAQQESIRANEVERLRADLCMATTEREILLRGLQEKRADVIANIFAGLDGAHAALQLYTNSLRSDRITDDELLRQLSTHSDSIKDNFYPNVIYLPQDLVCRIREMLGRMRQLRQFEGLVRGEEGRQAPQSLEGLQSRIDGLKDDLQKRMAELEVLFRSLVGSFEGRAQVASATDGADAQL